MAEEGQLVSPAAEIFKKANKIASIGADGKLIASQIPEGISGANKYEDYIIAGKTIEEVTNNADLTITTPSPDSMLPSCILISPANTIGESSSIDISCPQNENSFRSLINITGNSLKLNAIDTIGPSKLPGKINLSAENINLKGTIDNNKLYNPNDYSGATDRYMNVPGAKGWYVVGYYQDPSDPTSFKLWLNDKQVSYENMSTNQEGPGTGNYIDMSGKAFASNCLVFYNDSHFINNLIYINPNTDGSITVKCIEQDSNGNYALPPRQADTTKSPFRYGIYFSGSNATLSEEPDTYVVTHPDLTNSTSIEAYENALNYGEVDLSFTAFTSGYTNANGGFGTLTVGRNNASLGQFSTIIGRENYSEGYCSLIVGQRNECGGQKSLVVGSSNKATKNYNTLLGKFLTSNIEGEVVLGSYNIISTNENSAFVIGSGTDDASDTRTNAIQILKDGSIILPAYSVDGSTKLDKTYVKLRACKESSSSNVYVLKSQGSSSTESGGITIWD